MVKPENPEDFVHPADSALFMHGAGESANSHREALRNAMAQLLGEEPGDVAEKKIKFPATGEFKEAMMPLVCFVLSRVRMGDVIDLPRVTQWLNFFEDILAEGFDHSREKVRAFQRVYNDEYLGEHSVELEQGFTRISALIFCCHWSMFYYQRSMTDQTEGPELQALRECPATIFLPGFLVTSSGS